MTMVYKYAAKAPKNNLKEVEGMFYLAHKYRNALCAVELARRKAANEVLLKFCPDLAEVEKQITDLEGDLEELNRQQKQANQAARKTVNLEEVEKQIAAVKAKLKPLRQERKALRAKYFADEAFAKAWEALQAKYKANKKRVPTAEKTALQKKHFSPLKAALAEVDEEANENVKAARAENGLYWGTGCFVEQAADKMREGCPPRFLPWSIAQNKRAIAVQIQHGMTVAELHGCQDTRLRLALPPGSFDERKRSQKKTTCMMRVGSDGRVPIWSYIPVVMHRPLPADAIIKWAYLVRDKVATKYKWSLHLVIETQRESVVSDGPAVAIDIGWRLMEDGLRVGYWQDANGKSAPIVFPQSVIDDWKYVEELQSGRDKAFDVARAALVAWMKDKALPAWMVEMTERLSQWRSPARLARLAVHWRGNRFEGDNLAFAALDDWRANDKRGYEEQENIRQNAQRWRQNFYRNVAARLAGRRVFIEDLDLQKLSRGLPAELRWYKSVAAAGELFECLWRVANVVPVNPAFTTQDCAECGYRNAEFDFERHLSCKCAECGAEWDQDQNAAANLLEQGERLIEKGVQVAA